MNENLLCEDCIRIDKKIITCDFDAGQMGHVCPRCGRVYGGPNNAHGHLHFATKEHAMARIEHDKREQAMSVSTAGVVDRIMKDRF